jgi:adenylosuccinate synthase
VSHELRETIRTGGKVLLEGPQSFWLSCAAEKFWDSGTSANTGAAGMLAASRLNVADLNSLVINIHKTPGSSRVGGGANPCAFVPQNYFNDCNGTKEDFDEMKLDWRTVSRTYFEMVQPNGLVKPAVHSNSTGSYDLGVAMAAASCVHPTHREFGVTSGRPRVVGFFDCVMQAELIANQGPYCSISAFDRGDDYDEYGVCIAYVYHHPEGLSMHSNGREFKSGTIIKAGEQLPTQAIMAFCQPIVKKVSGWRDTPIFARSDAWKNRVVGGELPGPVCEIIDTIEHFTGTKIMSIGNGPRGGDIIYIKRVGDGAQKEVPAAPQHNLVQCGAFAALALLLMKM